MTTCVFRSNPFLQRMGVEHLAGGHGLRRRRSCLKTTAYIGERRPHHRLRRSLYREAAGPRHTLLPREGITAAQRIRDRLVRMEVDYRHGLRGQPERTCGHARRPLFEFRSVSTTTCAAKSPGEFELVFFTRRRKPGNRPVPRPWTGCWRKCAKRGIRPTSVTAQGLCPK